MQNEGALPTTKLLNDRDTDPVLKTGVRITESPFLLLGDHGGVAIPESLGTLGLGASDFARHIALDLGVEELGKWLSARLGSPFVWQAYSRLVCDCNRSPADSGWMAEISDATPIPGNLREDEAGRARRREEIFDPYHRAIAQALDSREAAGVSTVLVSLHSFTPAMADGCPRPWELGVLHDGREDGFSRSVLGWLQANSGRVVGNNEPYALCETDFTVPHHAFARGLRYLELEVRQDLLCGPEFVPIAELLAECFEACA